LAELVSTDTSDFKVSVINEERNRLFSPKMMELLYAKEVFKNYKKTEGAYSNAKAMT